MVTNTVVVTDKHLLDERNKDLLAEFETTVRESVPSGESVSVSVLRSLRRVVLIFDQIDTAKKVYEALQSQGISATYSLRNTSVVDSDATAAGGLLMPPERRIELQSPPPSPYLGYTQEPEEPPELITMTEPESFSHLLYQPTQDDLDKERVFNSKESISNIPLLVVDREEGEALRKRQQDIQQEKSSKP
ncbi:hypothetical protein OGAPHI_003293 [Ogataea philodendri]|uniref:Calcipressin-like protein n=1 Tax=Ogataea philodendri TaxID=1378263 RepID=A0A9P8T5Y8_9ASCO|nr:uncharacterized protein OGAPHI_003293 [Ogataea philodendri]KAH3666844.1 hypothetical protein OGAPHI_003293 [Ogataea philodendri]